MPRRQASIEYFTERIEDMIYGDQPVLGTSGLWEVKVETVLVPMLQATAVHPSRPSVCFRAADPRELAWKLVGVQVNMRPFQWDTPHSH